MIYCFDIDGTICSNTDGEYEDAKPFFEIIERVNRLFEEGNTIYFYTARGASTGKDWSEITKSHREVFNFLRAAGVGVNLHYIPVYRQPYYERLGVNVGLCPESERYYAEAFSLPIYPSMTQLQQDMVLATLGEFLEQIPEG